MSAQRYDDAVALLKRGATLSCCLPSSVNASDKALYEFSPRGGHVTASMFARLLPDLVEADAGLFPEVPAQSYRWGGQDMARRVAEKAAREAAKQSGSGAAAGR